MSKLISIVATFAVALCLASCGGNNSEHVTSHNNAPCDDSIAFDEFCSDYEKVIEYFGNGDFVNSRRLLDEIVSKYDFSAPTDRNVGRNVSSLMVLSNTYYLQAKVDRIRNDDDLIEKSMELARRAYKINRDSAANYVNKTFETQPEYRLLLKKYVE